MKQIIGVNLVIVMLAVESMCAEDPATNSDWCLAQDSFLSYYIENGCSISITLLADEGTVKLDGHFQVVSSDGSVILKGRYQANALDGDLLYFAPDGRLVSNSPYRNGVIVGDVVEWDESGRIKRITPYNKTGQKDGAERFLLLGMVVREIDWEDGSPVKMKEYTDGKLNRTIQGAEVMQWFKDQMRSAPGMIRQER